MKPKTDNTNGLILPAAITVNNTLVITAGTLNANNFAITVKGNWTNNVSTTAFTAGTAIVTFSGTVAEIIGGSFATSFNNLTIANTVSTVTLAVNTNINSDLFISNGTFNLAFTANRTTTGGSITVANGAILKIGGTNTFPGNYATATSMVASTVEYSGTTQTVANQSYGNLKLSGSAIKTLPATALKEIYMLAIRQLYRLLRVSLLQ